MDDGHSDSLQGSAAATQSCEDGGSEAEEKQGNVHITILSKFFDEVARNSKSPAATRNFNKSSTLMRVDGKAPVWSAILPRLFANGWRKQTSGLRVIRALTPSDQLKLDLPPFLTQPVKTQNPSGGARSRNNTQHNDNR
jgi:hypothetical protein